MTYALIESGAITRTGSLIAEFPNTSFQRPLPDTHEGWVKVVTPTLADGEKFTGNTVLISGVPTLEKAVIDSDDKAALLSAYRYEKETGGITVGGVAIQTDIETRTNLLGAKALNTSIKWKTPNGFVTLTAQNITDISNAVGLHVQNCFEAEDAVLGDIADYDTLAEIETAFDTEYAAL